jgi:hypothetical protein
VPVNFLSNKTHLINFLRLQHAWRLHLMIGNIRNNFPRTPNKCLWILFRLNPCPRKCGYNTEEAWHSAVGTVLPPHRNLDITGPSLKRNCGNGFHKQCYPLLAPWVADYPEQVMVTQVSYGSCLMCEIPTSVPMGHSTLPPLNNS